MKLQVIGKNRKTCNGNIPDYGNMSADKQRDLPHRDDYAVVARRRIHRFHVQDTGHDYQGFHSSVHCRTTCRITIKTIKYMETVAFYLTGSGHAGCMATGRTNQTGQKTPAQYG